MTTFKMAAVAKTSSKMAIVAKNPMVGRPTTLMGGCAPGVRAGAKNSNCSEFDKNWYGASSKGVRSEY